MKVLILCLFPNIKIFLSELKFIIDNKTETSLTIDWELTKGAEDGKMFKAVGAQLFNKAYKFKGVS